MLLVNIFFLMEARQCLEPSQLILFYSLVEVLAVYTVPNLYSMGYIFSWHFHVTARASQDGLH